jgi:hypothetical protein
MLNEIIAEIFPNLEKEKVIYTLEAFRIPNRKDQERNTPRHLIVKTLNIQNKEQILKAAREKQ